MAVLRDCLDQAEFDQRGWFCDPETAESAENFQLVKGCHGQPGAGYEYWLSGIGEGRKAGIEPYGVAILLKEPVGNRIKAEVSEAGTAGRDWYGQISVDLAALAAEARRLAACASGSEMLAWPQSCCSVSWWRSTRQSQQRRSCAELRKARKAAPDFTKGRPCSRPVQGAGRGRHPADGGAGAFRKGPGPDRDAHFWAFDQKAARPDPGWSFSTRPLGPAAKLCNASAAEWRASRLAQAAVATDRDDASVVTEVAAGEDHFSL